MKIINLQKLSDNEFTKIYNAFFNIDLNTDARQNTKFNDDEKRALQEYESLRDLAFDVKCRGLTFYLKNTHPEYKYRHEYELILNNFSESELILLSKIKSIPENNNLLLILKDLAAHEENEENAVKQNLSYTDYMDLYAISDNVIFKPEELNLLHKAKCAELCLSDYLLTVQSEENADKALSLYYIKLGKDFMNFRNGILKDAKNNYSSSQLSYYSFIHSMRHFPLSLNDIIEDDMLSLKEPDLPGNSDIYASMSELELKKEDKLLNSLEKTLGQNSDEFYYAVGKKIVDKELRFL